MSKNTLLIVIVATIALAAGIWVKNISNTIEAPDTAELNFILPDILGQQHRVTEWQGKILVINFWATWCPSCLKEIPVFIKLQKQFKAKNLQFIGIAIDNKPAVKEYLSRININYPMLIAGDKGIHLSKQLGNAIGAVPFTVIVNPQGGIIHRQAGEISEEKILEMIKPLLAPI